MRIAVVGAGAIARRAHLPAWRRIPEVDLMAVCDLDEALAKAVAAEFDIEHATTDYGSLLAEGSLDIVDICTPTPTHYDVAAAALQAGKHVIIEKPLAFTLREAIDLYQRVEATGLKLCIVQNWRYLDSVLRVRERVTAGRLGRIVTIHGTSFNHLPVGWTRGAWLYHSSGVLLDFTPHLIDVVLWLTDAPVEEVVAYGQDFTKHAEFLASAQILIRFRDGLVALLDTAWVINDTAFDLQLCGTGGRISLDLRRDFYEESHGGITPLHETRVYMRRMINTTRGVVHGNLSTKQLLVYEPLFHAFLQSVKTGGEPPVTVREGVRVNAVLEAANTSVVSGGAINVPRMLLSLGASSRMVGELL